MRWFCVWMLLSACSDDAVPSDRDSGSTGRDGGAGRDGALRDAGPPRDTGDGIPRPSMDVSDPNLRVIPWDGRAGAVSFTIDDGYGSALDAVAPALDARGVGGTFFVVCSAVEARVDEWRAVATSGVHEVANHTQTHAAASAASATEASDCHDYIRDTLGVAPTTFAYPYVEVGDPYQSYSRDNYVAARGAGDRLVLPNDDLDWTVLPSWFNGPGGGVGTPLDGILDAIAMAETEGGWAIMTAHSVETDDFYARISRADFEAMVDRAVAGDLWVGTFGDVAAYLRGAQSIEAATPTASPDHLEWSWTAAPSTPSPTLVRVLIDGGTLTQSGVELEWNSASGYYPVDVGRGALSWDR